MIMIVSKKGFKMLKKRQLPIWVV